MKEALEPLGNFPETSKKDIIDYSILNLIKNKLMDY